MAKKSYKRLADSIMTLLDKYNLSTDVTIFTGGHAYTKDGFFTKEGYEPYRNGWMVSLSDAINPCDYVEYDNPDTLSIHFEGPLYGELNYNNRYKIEDKLSKLFEKYGLYFEYGYAWSLSGYEM